MDEYLQLTDDKSEEAPKTEKTSLFLDLMIFRTVIGIIAAVGLLVIRITSPDTVLLLKDNFRRITESFSPADRMIEKTAEYITDFISDSPMDNAEKKGDRT